MEYVDALGSSLSRIGLGTWAMGGEGWFASIGAQEVGASLEVVAAANQCGVNWIDTAPAYGLGRSEELIGRALRHLPESERPFVFTKCGVVWDDRGEPDEDLTAAGVRRDCDESLRRLGVEHLDLLQIHWPATDGTPLEETWAVMADLVAAGKVRWLGVSNFSVEQMDTAESIRHVDTVQPPLSLLRRDTLAEVIPWCERHGTVVLVYSALESGLLAGTYSRDRIEALAEDDVRRTRPFFTPGGCAGALRLVDRLREIAAVRGCSVAEIALGWVLSRPGVTAAILGARSARQVREWATWAGLGWDADVAGAVDTALEELIVGSPELQGSGRSDDDRHAC
jgi:aryl-alcohol dehydrogenase-like predicted oxidoreductase